MKKRILSIFIIAVFMMSVAAGCTPEEPPPAKVLNIFVTNNATTVMQGEHLQFTAFFDGADVTDSAEWFVDDEDGTSMLIDQTGLLECSWYAVVGDSFVIHSEYNDTVSNEIRLTVVISNDTLSVAPVGNVALIKPGRTLQFNAKLNDNAISNGVKYYIDNSEDTPAVINETTGLLSCTATAVPGTVFKVYARFSSIESARYVMTVDEIALTSLTLSTSYEFINSKAYIHETMTFSVVKNPTDATVGGAILEVTEGSSFVNVNQDTKTISFKDEALWETISVCAKIGNVTSNIISFRVTAVDVIDDADYAIVSSAADENNCLTADYFASANNLDVMVFDRETGFLVDSSELRYSVIEGQNFLSVNAAGNLNVLGHGVAKVQASLAQFAEIYTVACIVPPEDFALPSYLSHSQSLSTYAYGISEEGGGDMPFTPATIRYAGTNNCSQSFKVSVRYSNGAEEDLAVNNGNITFANAVYGAAVLTLTSQSGSVKEATAEFSFLLNDGVNVSTYAELKQYFDTDKTINLMANAVLQLPSATAYDDLYNNRLYCYEKNKTIYGNGYKIDYSGISLAPAKSSSGDNFNGLHVKDDEWNLISFGSNLRNNRGASSYATEKVELFDLEILGNTGFFDTKGKPNAFADSTSSKIGYVKGDNGFFGSYARQISICNIKEFNMTNIKMTKGAIAVMTDGVLKSTIADCYFDDFYANTFRVVATIMDFENCVFGTAGGFSIDYDADRSGPIALSSNGQFVVDGEGRTQTLTFDERCLMNNLHEASAYMRNLLGNRDFTTVLTGAISKYNSNAAAQANMRSSVAYKPAAGAMEQFNFFIFRSTDASKVDTGDQTVIVFKDGSTVKDMNDTDMKNNITPNTPNTTDKCILVSYSTYRMRLYLINPNVYNPLV